MVTGAGHDSKRKERSSHKWWKGVNSIARKRKGRAVVVAGTTAAVAGKIILNSLITGLIFGEIALSHSGATVKTLFIMAILTGLVQSIVICPYPWHFLHLATGQS